RGAKGPTIHLVVDTYPQVGPSVAVMECEPRPSAIEPRPAYQEMRFHGVGLNDVGSQLMRQVLQGGEYRAIKAGALVNRIGGDSHMLGRAEKNVGIAPPPERR